MAAPAELSFLAPPPPAPEQDQFVVLHGVAWKTYCALRELFDTPGVRMTYLKGALEIMSPSRQHEGYKKRIARLLELFALERELPLSGYGSATLRQAFAERGLEPDECYVLGRELGEEDFPDIALEVVLSSGGVDKLEVYRGLGVREVWFWHQHRFHVYVLSSAGEGDDTRYEHRSRSELIPALDFEQLAALAEEGDQLAALKRYRQALRTR